MKTMNLPKSITNWILLLMLASVASAAEWQWSVPVKAEKPEGGPARAWLWIPPHCERVRGLVVAQQNMEEISILEHPKFRQGLAELGFAEIWVSPFFDHSFRFNAGAGETFYGMVNELAELSGYTELKFAPLVPMGHSAAASWPYYLAVWEPERTLAALSVSGQWPYVRDPLYAPDIWSDRKLDFIPLLESMGEYEAAATWSREGLKERADHPKMPLTMLANPAQGHFASSDQKVEQLVFYLKKAAQYRLPKDWDATSAPKLIPIDPTQTGWLADKWRRDQPPTAPPALVGKYHGDPKEAFWFFDEEHALETERYQAAFRGLKPQLVGYVQNGAMVAQKNSHLQVDLKFAPEADGVTFKLTGAFYDQVPAVSQRLSDWTLLPTNSPLDHAQTGVISIERISGPFEKLSADTFVVRFQRDTLQVTNARNYSLVFAATHPGDAKYKAAVQQAQMSIPVRNAQGREQHITFPEIPSQSVAGKSVKLAATSDAGMPAQYFVREGPAEIVGDLLRFTDIPPRAKFPVKIAICAYQYGRATEPKIQSAVPVIQEFLIKP